MGTSADILGRYERGEVTPPMEVASKLAEVLDVSLDYLSGKTDTELEYRRRSQVRFGYTRKGQEDIRDAGR